MNDFSQRLENAVFPLSVSRLAAAATLVLVTGLGAGGVSANTGGSSDMIRVYEAYAVYKMGRFDEAFDMYRTLAEEGSARGMLNLAHMYAHGEGVTQDQTRAYDWYRRSAEAGDVTAMLETAEAYRDGQGVTPDAGEADRWFLRAAESGNSEAQWLLGKRLHAAGDEEQGLEWIRTAARDGGQLEARRFLTMLDGEEAGGTGFSEAQQEAVLATLARIDEAARNRDPAGIVAPIRADARIRVRLPNGAGWNEMDREALQNLWQATFDQVRSYDYARSEPELVAVSDGMVAHSRVHERLDGSDGSRQLEIRETAQFRANGDDVEIHRLQLDIRRLD